MKNSHVILIHFFVICSSLSSRHSNSLVLCQGRGEGETDDWGEGRRGTLELGKGWEDSTGEWEKELRYILHPLQRHSRYKTGYWCEGGERDGGRGGKERGREGGNCHSSLPFDSDLSPPSGQEILLVRRSSSRVFLSLRRSKIPFQRIFEESISPPLRMEEIVKLSLQLYKIGKVWIISIIIIQMWLILEGREEKVKLSLQQTLWCQSKDRNCSSSSYCCCCYFFFFLTRDEAAINSNRRKWTRKRTVIFLATFTCKSEANCD